MSRDQGPCGQFKTARIPIRVVPMEGKAPRKPRWIRAKAPTDPKVFELKRLLRERALHTVCEEASCPNLGECFARGTATFMIMGDTCTKRPPMCSITIWRRHRPCTARPDRAPTISGRWT